MPAEVYIAPPGTTFPDIDAAPGVLWVRLGTAGNLNFTRDGVKIGHPQSVNVWRSAGHAGPRKVFRLEEDLKVTLEIADFTLEQYKQALNSNAITESTSVPGTADYKKIGLSRGLVINTVALLVRIPGGSPYMASGNSQYEIPRAQETGSSEPVLTLGEPALLSFDWMALVDPTAATEDEQFGRLICQTGETASSSSSHDRGGRGDPSGAPHREARFASW
jgi:hypothetical protein